MKFRTKDLKNYLTGEIDWKKISADLNIKSFESILKKDILDIDFLTNRYSDSASLIGLSREISIISKHKLITPQIKTKEPKKNFSDFVKIKIETPKCYNYFGKIIFNVKNQKSPKWLKEFVEFYGFNSVNFLVDLSNFVMIEYGAPVHMFDFDAIKSNPDLIIRESKENEIFKSFTEKEFILPSGVVVIEHNKKIIDLVGIQGGEFAKITLNTKNILIQSPIIESAIIRETSKKINLKTDASYRFERGISFINSSLAIDRLGCLIEKNVNGKTASNKITFGKIPEQPKVFLHFGKIKEYSGFDLSSKNIESTLKKIGCQIAKRTNSYLYLSIPPWRLDLFIEEDLIEEIIRIEGLDKIENKIPKSRILAKEDDFISFNDLIKRIITSAGFDEIVNYSFIDNKDFENLGEIFSEQELVVVLNPVSRNYSIYRPFIFTNLIKSAKENMSLTKEIRIFEIGHCAKIFKNKIIENKKLGFLISLPNVKDMLLESNGLIKALFEKIGIEARIKNTHLDIFESSGYINFDDETRFGFIGLLNKDLSFSYDLDQRVVVGELDLDLILKNFEMETTYQPIPEFPSIIRDISLIVPEISQIDHLESEIQFLGDDILESVNLFDVYQSDDMPDKKSIAFRLVFRANDRSLTDNEVNKIMQKIANSLMDKFGAGIR